MMELTKDQIRFTNSFLHLKKEKKIFFGPFNAILEVGTSYPNVV